MSTNPAQSEVEAVGGHDGETQPAAEAPPDTAPSPPARPHEPGARPTPLSRLLYP